MHIARLIIIAENPKIIMTSLRKGNLSKEPETAPAAPFEPEILKKAQIKNAILQMNANLEKNETALIY